MKTKTRNAAGLLQQPCREWDIPKEDPAKKQVHYRTVNESDKASKLEEVIGGVAFSVFMLAMFFLPGLLG